MVLSGDLSFEKENVGTVCTVPDKAPSTHGCYGSLELFGILTKIPCRFQFTFFMQFTLFMMKPGICSHWLAAGNDRCGDLNSLISKSRSKPGIDFASVHCWAMAATNLSGDHSFACNWSTEMALASEFSPLIKRRFGRSPDQAADGGIPLTDAGLFFARRPLVHVTWSCWFIIHRWESENLYKTLELGRCPFCKRNW